MTEVLKYYKVGGEVYAFNADGSQDDHIPAGAKMMTAAQVAAHTAPIAEEPDPKMVGILFEGVMCSATAEDQNGLSAVLVAIQLQGADFPPTRFHFANGNTLVLTADNWQAFAAVWLPFRQSFFTP